MIGVASEKGAPMGFILMDDGVSFGDYGPYTQSDLIKAHAVIADLKDALGKALRESYN